MINTVNKIRSDAQKICSEYNGKLNRLYGHMACIRALATDAQHVSIINALERSMRAAIKVRRDECLVAIAKLFGGGGHRNAASFYTSIDVLALMLDIPNSLTNGSSY